MEEPTIKVASEEELKFIDMKSKDYVAQGSTPEDAAKLAAEDWQKMQGMSEEDQDALWNNLTKRIGLADFLDDQIRRALGRYKTEWEKRNPILNDDKTPMLDDEGKPMHHTIDFKLSMSKLGGLQGRSGQPRMIGGVQLILEVKKNGLWKTWRRKEIKFTHIREMKEGHTWKLALYESMLHDLIMTGVTYQLMTDSYNDGTLKPRKPEPAATEGTEARQ